jgi:hypothetical protein
MPPLPARLIRFVSAETEEGSGGQWRSRVVLLHQDGQTHVGEAEGAGEGSSAFALAARASAQAVLRAVGGPGDALEVTGATVTEAFGKRTVFVQVEARYRGQRRELMGFCLVDPDPARAAALAVLNAVNRFLGIG